MAATYQERAAAQEREREQALAKLPEVIDRLPDIPINDQGAMVLGTLRQVYTVAGILYETGWLPSTLKTVQQVAIVVLQCRALNIDPMQGIWEIAVINNKPVAYGTLFDGIARSRGADPVARIEEWWELDGERLEVRPNYRSKAEWPDQLTAVCRATTRAGAAAIGQFSVADARAAKQTAWAYDQASRQRVKTQVALWDKEGPWQEFPGDMLQRRASSRAYRKANPDGLRGLWSEVEADDVSAPKDAREPEYEVAGDGRERRAGDAVDVAGDLAPREAAWEAAGDTRRAGDAEAAGGEKAQEGAGEPYSDPGARKIQKRQRADIRRGIERRRLSSTEVVAVFREAGLERPDGAAALASTGKLTRAEADRVLAALAEIPERTEEPEPKGPEPDAFGDAPAAADAPKRGPAERKLDLGPPIARGEATGELAELRLDVNRICSRQEIPSAELAEIVEREFGTDDLKRLTVPLLRELIEGIETGAWWEGPA